MCQCMINYFELCHHIRLLYWIDGLYVCTEFFGRVCVCAWGSGVGGIEGSIVWVRHYVLAPTSSNQVKADSFIAVEPVQPTHTPLPPVLSQASCMHLLTSLTSLIYTISVPLSFPFCLTVPHRSSPWERERDRWCRVRFNKLWSVPLARTCHRGVYMFSQDVFSFSTTSELCCQGKLDYPKTLQNFASKSLFHCKIHMSPNISCPPPSKPFLFKLPDEILVQFMSTRWHC